MNTPSVPQVEFAAYDAMKEVASSLKAAYFRRSLATENAAEIAYWDAQEDAIDRAIAAVDATSLEQIEATSQFIADLLAALSDSSAAA